MNFNVSLAFRTTLNSQRMEEEKKILFLYNDSKFEIQINWSKMVIVFCIILSYNNCIIRFCFQDKTFFFVY